MRTKEIIKRLVKIHNCMAGLQKSNYEPVTQLCNLIEELKQVDSSGVLGSVIKCTDCDNPLPKDSESNTCTECFYKDRYKYD